ncbi:unnamed protein product [Phytophthora fragariaefolia]|uniref:Unnamed protein product n=1 Tax=Phytophthora fragariaefolia TaxID=1490495 RepID=A0A9W6XSK6_9STRA|nr:unnamed protein product [Phytophthora fragariaefolia]
MAFKFEFIKPDASSPVTPAEEALEKEDEAPQDVNMTVIPDESFEATQLADPPSPTEKKRKRIDEGPVVVTVATQELESKLTAAQHQIAALNEKLEQTIQVKVKKLHQENLSLMAKLEAATAENLKLKTDLAAKDREMEVKIKAATKKRDESSESEVLKLKNELVAKDKALELKIKEAIKKNQEADRVARAEEMATKLKEATKKYQQKVEAENFEQRREMSERMAAFSNENEKLQSTLGTKEEELAECEDKIASLREKVTSLTSSLTAKDIELAERQKKIAELEKKVSASKDECSEIMGLLTAAEEKALAAENKAAEASIAAAAAVSANKGTNSNERHELQEAITSLRTELETISQDDDAETLRACLAAVLNLFGQVQALGLQGVGLITGAISPELGDLHLLSAASVESERTSTAVPNSLSSSTTEQNVQATAKDSPAQKTTEKQVAKKSFEDSITKEEKATHAKDAVNGSAAEPKASPTKLKREKKKSIKQAAPLSAAIEADAVSAIAAMASAGSSGKSSPSDASTAVANGDGDGDWEMLELETAAELVVVIDSPTIVFNAALSPTMETGNMSKWNLKEGDTITAGDIVCEIETDKAIVDYEATDDMFLAKILIPEGAENIPVGQPMMVVCDEEESIAAFKDFKLEDAPVAPAAPVLSEEEKPPKKEEVAVDPSTNAPVVPQDFLVTSQTTKKTVPGPAIPASPVAKPTPAAPKAASPAPVAGAVFEEKWGLGIKKSAISTSLIKKQQAYIALYGITGMTPAALPEKKK